MSHQQASAEFGVIVTCSHRDLWMAKGCCASVRHFMPDVPLCLLFDGAREQAASLARTYDALVLCRDNVESEFLRERSFGYGVTKMIAFWESPFDSFLLIDADTVVIGDMREHANFAASDIIVNGPRQYRPDQVERGFFNTQRLLEAFPGATWDERQVFNSGVIFARKDVFRLEDYEQLLDAAGQFPDLFKAGDQGMLNFLVIRDQSKKQLRFAQAKLQVIVGYAASGELENAIGMSNGDVVSRSGRAIVLHYAGVRPYTSNRHPYTQPMTHFRKMYRNDYFKQQKRRAASLRTEEFFTRHPKMKKTLHLLLGDRC